MEDNNKPHAVSLAVLKDEGEPLRFTIIEKLGRRSKCPVLDRTLYVVMIGGVGLDAIARVIARIFYPLALVFPALALSEDGRKMIKDFFGYFIG